MTFFSRLPRLAAVLALCACLPPTVLANVVEAAAGTLLEATPLLLGAELAGRLIRRPRALTWFAALGGCGCGPLPGALAVPAFALCALAFGPLIAFGRFLAAFAIMRLRAQKCRADRIASPCILDQLGTIGLLAFFSALFLALIRAQAFGLNFRAMPEPLLFAGGVVLGLLTPCTLGALATAAGLRAGAAPLALGMLCSAGVLPMPGRRPAGKGGASFDGRWVYGFMALACGAAAAQGGAGLVHPKLTPLVALGAVCAFASALGPPARAGYPALLAAFLMVAGLILHVPPPIYNPGETTLENIYPGQDVRFTGEVSGDQTPTTLVRYAVTCCRADASPLALRLDRRLNERNGAWIEAQGTIERDTGGMHLHVRRYRRIAQPSDPFLYQ